MPRHGQIRPAAPQASMGDFLLQAGYPLDTCELFGLTARPVVRKQKVRDKKLRRKQKQAKLSRRRNRR